MDPNVTNFNSILSVAAGGLRYFKTMDLYISAAKLEELLVGARASLVVTATPELLFQNGNVVVLTKITAVADSTIMLRQSVLDTLSAMTETAGSAINFTVSKEVEGGHVPKINTFKFDTMQFDGDEESSVKGGIEYEYAYEDGFDLEDWLSDLSDVNIGKLTDHFDISAKSKSKGRLMTEAKLNAQLENFSPAQMFSLLTQIGLDSKLFPVSAVDDKEEVAFAEVANDEDNTLGLQHDLQVAAYSHFADTEVTVQVAHPFLHSPYAVMFSDSPQSRKKKFGQLLEAVAAYERAYQEFHALEGQSVTVEPVMQADGETVNSEATAALQTSARSDKAAGYRRLMEESQQIIVDRFSQLSMINASLTSADIESFDVDNTMAYPSVVRTLMALVSAAFVSKTELYELPAEEVLVNNQPMTAFPVSKAGMGMAVKYLSDSVNQSFETVFAPV